MAELGAIASIIGLVSVGVKLSKTLYSVGSRAAEGSSNIQRVATNVTLFVSVLKHFGAVMKDTQSLQSPEAVDVAMQVVNECESVFEELGKMVAGAAGQKTGRGGQSIGPNDSKRRQSFVHRVKFFFQESRVERLLAQLEYLKTTLSVLIQTLNLAAVTANAREMGNIVEQQDKINEDRVHVEALLIARQLSIVILQQFNFEQPTEENENSLRPSPSDSVESLEQAQPMKLLTQTPNDATSLIKVGRGNLAFLDHADPRPEEVMSPEMASSHSELIDRLLNRWTRLPQIELMLSQRQQPNGIRAAEELAVEELIEEQPENTLAPPLPRRPPGSRTPDLKLDFGSVPSNYQAPTVADASPPVAETPKILVRSDSLPFTEESNAINAPIPVEPTLPIPLAAVPQRGMQSPPPASNARPSGSRTESLSGLPPPPSDVQQAPQARRPSPSPSMRDNQRAESLPIRPNQYIPASPIMENPEFALDTPPISPSTMHYYTGHRPQSSGSISGPPSSWHGPTRPRINSMASEASTMSHDEDDHSRRNGLNVHWRIRIGKNYYDFEDTRLVGPRQPHTPNVSIDWLVQQNMASTEVSNDWVAEQAIIERKYPYTKILPAEEGSAAVWLGSTNTTIYRILCPLRFEDVEALVERTLTLFHENSQRRTSQPPLERANTAPAFQILSPSTHTPLQPSQPSQPIQRQQKSVTFPDSYTTRGGGSGGLRADRDRSPRTSPRGSPRASTDFTNAAPQPSYGTSPGNNAPRFMSMPQQPQPQSQSQPSQPPPPYSAHAGPSQQPGPPPQQYFSQQQQQQQQPPPPPQQQQQQQQVPLQQPHEPNYYARQWDQQAQFYLQHPDLMTYRNGPPPHSQPNPNTSKADLQRGLGPHWEPADRAHDRDRDRDRDRQLSHSRERERERDKDRDRDYNRDRDRDRDERRHGAGGERSHRHHGHRERDKSRDKEKEKDKEDKHRARAGMAKTAVRIGGIMALLEGLDM